MGKAKRVVLFGIDGAGTFFEQANTPNMDRLFARGAVCRRVLTEIPSISAQCWGSMLHGVPCLWHGLTNAIADVRPYPGDSPYPSVFRAVREAREDAVLASFCDWDSVNVGIIENGLDVYKYHAKDADLIDPAIRYIRETDFTLMYFHFDSVDGAGHRYGYGTTEHLAAIEKNDELVGRIVSAAEERGWLEDTLLLVEADHGGTPNYGYGGQHGGATEAEKYVSFFAAGPGILPGEFEGMLVRDTPAVILHALGIAQPEGWTARVPAGLFADCPEGTPRSAGLPPMRTLSDRTPLPEQGGLAEVLGEHVPILHLPFESDEEFPTSAQSHGKLYRLEGMMGKAMSFQDGSLTMDSPELSGSCSILFWIRPDQWLAGESQTVLAAGSSCRQVDREKGISIEVAEDFLRLCHKGPMGTIPVHLDMTAAGDLAGKWTHVTVTQDREGERFGISLNFAPFEYWATPKNMDLFDRGMLYIGRDALADPTRRLSAALDDLCICRGAVTEEILRKLKEYYQV